MKLNLFKRNKQAKTTPINIGDFISPASNYATVNEIAFTCIDRIASSFASLSFSVYSNRTHKKVNHPVYETLLEPNLDTTKTNFLYSCVLDYYSGNVYLKKVYNSNGDLISLFRLNPNEVIVSRGKNNIKVFSYRGETYTSDQVLQISSRYNFDGLKGHSIFEACHKSFELAQNLDAYTNNVFDKSISGKRLVIDLQGSPNADDKTQQAVINKYLSKYGGNNNYTPIVKTKGIEFSMLDTGVSTNQAVQLTENRQYQQEIICEIFGIPVSYLNGSGNYDLENTSTMFITNAILPLCNVFQESFQKLFKPEERNLYYIEFNYNSILKTSLQQKIDAYSKQIQMSLLTVNEARAKENLPPLEAGDYSWLPSNLIPVTQENVSAILAKSKLALKEAENPQTEIEKAEQAETVVGLGSNNT